MPGSLKVRQLLQTYGRGVPLLGGLVDCTWQAHWESLRQTFLVTFLSTTPIWLGALIVYSTGSDLGRAAFSAALWSTVQHGELFMYSTALLAPVFWMALVDPPGARAFPSKIPHMALIGIIDLVAGAFFGLITAHTNVNPAFVSTASRWMFFASLALLYLGTVYHTNRLPDITGAFRKQEDSFSAEFNERKP